MLPFPGVPPVFDINQKHTRVAPASNLFHTRVNVSSIHENREAKLEDIFVQVLHSTAVLFENGWVRGKRHACRMISGIGTQRF